MTNYRTWMKEGLLTGAFLFAVVLALPVIALALFLARFVLLGAAILAVAAGVGMYVFNPSFRLWFEEQAESLISYKGLRLASELGFHSSHSWARVEPDMAFVGADDIVQSVLGPVQAVEFPREGTRVRSGERLATLKRGERSVELISPISGTVLAFNQAVKNSPELLNKDPFHEGWLVRMKPNWAWAERRRLLRGGTARKWFREEVDRLISLLQQHDPHPVTLADGGEVVRDLYKDIDDQTWQEIIKSFLLGPAKEDA